MSSPDSTKKRRIAMGSGGGDNNGIVDDGSSTTMSTILAKLNDMENRCISMQSELDKCISSRDSMQEEMNTMQKRLSHMDELEKKCTNLDTRCESLQRSVQILSIREHVGVFCTAYTIEPLAWISRGLCCWNANIFGRYQEVCMSIEEREAGRQHSFGTGRRRYFATR